MPHDRKSAAAKQGRGRIKRNLKPRKPDDYSNEIDGVPQDHEEEGWEPQPSKGKTNSGEPNGGGGKPPRAKGKPPQAALCPLPYQKPVLESSAATKNGHAPSCVNGAAHPNGDGRAVANGKKSKATDKHGAKAGKPQAQHDDSTDDDVDEEDAGEENSAAANGQAARHNMDLMGAPGTGEPPGRRKGRHR